MLLQELSPVLEDRQLDIERLARVFIAHYEHRCLYYLPAKLATLKTDPDGLYDFPGALLRDAFPNRRGLSKFSPEMQAFIKERPTLRLAVDLKHGSANASYRPNSTGGEIILSFGAADYTNFRNDLDRPLHLALSRLLQTRFTSMVHELQHAYDDWASKGRFRDNQRSMKAMFAKGEEKRQLYLTDPVEISARYRHTVSEIDVRMPWKDYAYKFRYTFDGWRLLLPDEQRRLIRRLAAYWISRHPQGERDIGTEVKEFQNKLRAQFGGHIYLHYSNTRENVISIDSFGTKDRTIRQAILNAVIRFADVRRAVVATSDMPYTPAARTLGFVNQRSRNRDYALPISTTMYRPARAPLARSA